MNSSCDVDKGRMLLITGLGRSGSTILQKVVDAHPSAFVSDESWHYLTVAGLYAGRNRRAMMGMSEQQYAACMGRYLCSLYSAVAGSALVCGDKCPPAFTLLEEIGILLGTQHCKLDIIWTVRHPFDIALSWIERFRENSLRELSFYGIQAGGRDIALPQVVDLIFRVWLRQQRAMRQYSGYVVKYEDLTAAPVAVLTGLHAWLDIDFSTDQLDRAFSSRVIGGDPKFSDTDSVHVHSRYRYRGADTAMLDLLQRAAVHTGIEAHCAQYGYET